MLCWYVSRYDCAASSKTKSFPLQRMWSYLDSVSTAGPPADGSLYTAQCLWEETTDSIIIGETHGSR